MIFNVPSFTQMCPVDRKMCVEYFMEFDNNETVELQLNQSMA